MIKSKLLAGVLVAVVSTLGFSAVQAGDYYGGHDSYSHKKTYDSYSDHKDDYKKDDYSSHDYEKKHDDEYEDKSDDYDQYAYKKKKSYDSYSGGSYSSGY